MSRTITDERWISSAWRAHTPTAVPIAEFRRRTTATLSADLATVTARAVDTKVLFMAGADTEPVALTRFELEQLRAAVDKAIADLDLDTEAETPETGDVTPQQESDQEPIADGPTLIDFPITINNALDFTDVPSGTAIDTDAPPGGYLLAVTEPDAERLALAAIGAGARITDQDTGADWYVLRTSADLYDGVPVAVLGDAEVIA